jgi:hypothetical protein
MESRKAGATHRAAVHVCRSRPSFSTILKVYPGRVDFRVVLVLDFLESKY